VRVVVVERTEADVAFADLAEPVAAAVELVVVAGALAVLVAGLLVVELVAVPVAEPVAAADVVDAVNVVEEVVEVGNWEA
jgi:hypothetical protein